MARRLRVPDRRLPGIERLPRHLVRGRYQDNPEFAQYPVVAEQYLALNPEIKLDEERKQAWLGNRMGAIVGRPVANQYGWQIGDRVPLKSSIWTRNNGSDVWEFDIEGVFDDTDAGMNAGVVLFHYDYFDEARAFGKGTVGWYVSKGDGSLPLNELMDSIDAEFANSPAETKTNTEAAFAQEYAQQFGNVGLIVTLILAAVVFMILLVTGPRWRNPCVRGSMKWRAQRHWALRRKHLGRTEWRGCCWFCPGQFWRWRSVGAPWAHRRFMGRISRGPRTSGRIPSFWAWR